MKHYEVVSPEMIVGHSYDPPAPGEPCASFAFVVAETPAKAKAAALRTPDFALWLRESDNPFTGLRVRLSRCRHGVCYCDACCAAGASCAACEAEIDAELEADRLRDETGAGA